jgi:hypothetical protein
MLPSSKLEVLRVITDKGLLFIEPRNPASAEPVVDDLTKRMAAALNDGVGGTGDTQASFRPGGGLRGWHDCVCGACSSNQNYLLSDGQVTNSLCVHYLAHHRGEVPESELRKVRSLPSYEAEPTRHQLRGYGRMGGPQRQRIG